MKRYRKNILICIILVLIISIPFLYNFFINNNNYTNDGWFKNIDGTVYYINNEGNQQTGWATINNRPYYFNNDGTLVDKLKVIDISKYQGNIDFKAVKSSGISMVMMRSSYGWIEDSSQIDPNFERNIKLAHEQGMKVGVYHYSHAKNESEAIKEAKYCLNAIKKYNIELPVAYDIENDQHANLTSAQISNLAVAFCEEIKKNGYIPMIYSNIDFFNNIFDYNKISDYDIWVAQYEDKCTYSKKYTMWQYTQTGLIDGIEGNVDFNYYYFYNTIRKP